MNAAITLCGRHAREGRTVVPAACPTCRRLNVERDIVLKTIDAMLAAGYALAINDRGGDTDIRPETPTTHRDAIIREVMETDDDFLAVYTLPLSSSRTDALPMGWVRFVYGNDGWDVISDYTTNLDAIMDPITSYAAEQG